MRTLNKVFLLGAVGRDPDMKSSQGGKPIANLSIATTESYKDNSGQWQNKTEWHNLVAFNRTAEVIRDYVQKGAKVHVEGRLQTQQWEKDGQTHRRTVIIVDELIMMEGQGGGNGGRQQTAIPSPRQQSQRPPQNQQRSQQNGRRDNTPSWDAGDEIDESEIPF